MIWLIVNWLDWYNFNAPEGCCVDPPGKGNDQLPKCFGFCGDDGGSSGSSGIMCNGICW